MSHPYPAADQTLFDKRAIVIGSSMSGLLTARALADHFEQVILLERDYFPAAGENRKGVPQGKHSHAILVRGLQLIEGYFPGLTEQLVTLGADHGDVSQKARWFYGSEPHQPMQCGYNAINVSRPLLEATIRTRVLALPNVRAIDGCDVLGLLTNADKTRVTGVRVIPRKADSAEETLAADLIVDATGRGSRSPAWLEALGYARPREEEIKIGVTYVSCQYKRLPEHIPGVVALIVAASPTTPRSGVLLSQEGDRWILTVASYLGEQPPLNHADLVAYVGTLDTLAIYQVIKNAEPLCEPALYKIPSNLRRRYEQLMHFPQGYLVMGDALCSFNPIYGQGISVAALESAALSECLAQGEAHLAKRFFAEASKIIDIPWGTAVGNDLSLPGVEGPRTLMTKFINWYISKLHHAARHDAELSLVFLKVVNLLAPPPTILRPSVVWRVVQGNLFNRGHKSYVDNGDMRVQMSRAID